MDARERFLAISKRPEKEEEPFKPTRENPECQWLILALYGSTIVVTNRFQFLAWIQDGLTQEEGLRGFCASHGFKEITDALVAAKDAFPNDRCTTVEQEGKPDSKVKYVMKDTDYAIFCEHFAGAQEELRLLSDSGKAHKAWKKARSIVLYLTAHRFGIADASLLRLHEHVGTDRENIPQVTWSEEDGYRFLIGSKK